MKKIFCDWCGKEVIRVIDLYLESKSKMESMNVNQQHYELCEECGQKIVKMIDSLNTENTEV